MNMISLMRASICGKVYIKPLNDDNYPDPKILQDVQRVLHFQSQRRDGKSIQGAPPVDGVLPSTDMASNSYASTTTAPKGQGQSSPKYPQTSNLPSEVDFSPSTRTAPLHPVPLSSNGGATLDWTGSQSEDEKVDRRWSISRVARRGKDKVLPSSKAIVEKQETLFTDRISRIKAEASSPTVRKAAIVSEQLGRRYNVLYSSITNGQPVNLAKIARWYARSGPETQAWLNSAEPLTWLKHLLDRRGGQRSEWHVSALIMEEYMKFKKGETRTPLPQSVSLTTESSSPNIPPFQSSPYLTQRHTVTTPSESSLDTSLGRVRSVDGSISFGPVTDYSRGFIEDSQSRSEGKTQGQRRSLPTFFDPVSVNETPPYNNHGARTGISPASSRLNFSDIVHRLRRHTNESDEGSFVLGSQSEDQKEPGSISLQKRAEKKKQVASKLHSSPSVTELNVVSERCDSQDSIPLLPVSSSVTATFPRPPTAKPEATSGVGVGSAESKPTVVSHRRSYRSTSLPNTTPPLDCNSVKHHLEYDVENAEREYELKSRMLERLKNHNHRLRHRMQRVAVDVREYEIMCSNVLPLLGVPYRHLPAELLDAISHDPSSVTGGTRKRGGWRAVEDIHDRIARQRGVMHTFLSLVIREDGITATDNVLDTPISTLMEKLQIVEREQGPLRKQADIVARMLTDVRTIHTAVKDEYNDAVAYTSVVYPELSQIVALEESYRDQYQQVWEIGMEALTFILDTITPFWRNYGKTIGEDIQDFLIIPWYRNEFTGEAKRYPIKSLPRRSVRHWFALLLLIAFTASVTVLQARAAITSSWNYRLPWIENQGFRWTIIPLFWMAIAVQWFAVIFELSVVMLQFAVVAWWLGWFVGTCT
ncbi:hypothetical protein F5I97DRAFT_1218846 [Phlebopus sp. FC_14]|nr:hypothetical protein F5I97DRAFT_1218846 [Phlebopus sp. FC_14]